MNRGNGSVEGVDAEEEVADGLVLLEGNTRISLVVVEECGYEFEWVEVRMAHEDVDELCWCVDHKNAAVSVEDGWICLLLEYV